MDSKVKTPRISYGEWCATPELRWHVVVGSIDHRELQQKFRRKVKRDFGHGSISRGYEFEWKPIPEGM